MRADGASEPQLAAFERRLAQLEAPDAGRLPGTELQPLGDIDALADGVTRMAFGDLFLADVRAYREQMLAPTGIEPVFPLWGRDTTALAREMVDRGVRATLTCVDPRQLDPGFAGREYDDQLLADLPRGVDPCGENGEFHTFVHDGPGFAHPLAVRTGEVVHRDGFVFADVLPAR
jgi:diphthamide synthase (EF-2-diphthine--ammonia ligase)